MKIAILSFFSGINERGVERWVYELGNRLTKDREVVVYQNGPKLSNSFYKTKSIGLTYSKNKKEILLPLQKKSFFRL